VCNFINKQNKNRLKGLTNRGEQKVYYVTPSGGKLTLSSKSEREGYVKKTFTGKDGTVVTKFVMEFDTLKGFLEDAKVEQTDYGKRWTLKITIEDEVYYVQFKYSSGYSRSFFNQLEMIDLSKPISLNASHKEEEHDGKITQSVALWVSQDGNWVGFKYTKDNPGDLPKWEEVTVKGEVVKDDTAIMEFYEKKATAIFNELKLTRDQAAADSFMESEITGEDVVIPSAGVTSSTTLNLTPDDLPF